MVTPSFVRDFLDKIDRFRLGQGPHVPARRYTIQERLFKRVGIEDFTGHDLSRTFATMVMVAGKDELLAMRLIRDAVPGVGSRYIKYPMDQLVDALKMYSPVKLDGESEKPPVPEAVIDLVETGES